MRNVTLISLTLITLAIQSIGASATELSAREIMDRAIESTKLQGAEAVSTLTIIDDKGRERVRKIAQVTKLYDDGDTEKKLIRFLAPADVKGTGLLTFDYKARDDDMWLYMPALRKMRRIISSEKAKNFMGSEFSYADMSPPILDDFEYTLLSTEMVEGVECWQIEVVPRDEDIADENGFSRRIVFIGRDDSVVRRAIYYDLDGELHKELTVRSVQELDPENHKYRPTHMVMENKQNGRGSLLIVDQIQFNPDIKDEYFTVRYLERE